MTRTFKRKLNLVKTILQFPILFSEMTARDLLLFTWFCTSRWCDFIHWNH